MLYKIDTYVHGQTENDFIIMRGPIADHEPIVTEEYQATQSGFTVIIAATTAQLNITTRSMDECAAIKSSEVTLKTNGTSVGCSSFCWSFCKIQEIM